MSSPSPENGNPYQVLGVAATATEAQINKAWRRRTKSIGPGSPEFAAINAAAELLLDPSRRRAYDAEVAGAEPQPSPTEPAAPPADSSAPSGPKRTISGWNGTIIFAGVMALITAGLAIWLGVRDSSGPSDAASVSSARTAAAAAAQVELPVVLSYDYHSMPSVIANSERFLSAAQRQRYATTMQRIINGGTIPGTSETLAPVAQRKAVVVTTVTSVGIISATATTAQVGAYVKQVTTQASGPATHQNWVQVGMILQGGSWLIDGICVPSAGMTCTATSN